jgi:hypothetical protein
MPEVSTKSCLAAFGLAIVSISSCAPTTRNSLIGKYALTRSGASGELILHGNGELEESITVKGQAAKTLKGSWTLEGGNLKRQPCISLGMQDGFGSQVEACSHAIEHYLFRKPIIILNPDTGVSYVQQSNAP